MEGAKAEEKYRNAIVHVEFEAPDFPLGIELVQRRHGGVMIGSLASGGNAQMLYEGILERGHRLLTSFDSQNHGLQVLGCFDCQS